MATKIRALGDVEINELQASVLALVNELMISQKQMLVRRLRRLVHRQAVEQLKSVKGNTEFTVQKLRQLKFQSSTIVQSFNFGRNVISHNMFFRLRNQALFI